MQIGTENRLMRKRSTSQGRTKFVAAFEEVYQAVKQAHAAVGHGGDPDIRKVKELWNG